MPELEQRIKDFVRERGVEVVGTAGPGRLDGPPSLDLAYTLPGARSIVSMALPMDVGAIYDFLGKKSPTPHNLDQLQGNQRVFRVADQTAGFIRSLGHRAAAVPANNTYRRSLDHFATHPSFSHRFGAIAAGIAAQGWSGNVMTREHGAAVYLCTVVTDAVLASDPALPPRYFIDGFCARCKLCARACTSCMFEEEGEEYVLLNGELHPRGRRRNIDLCNASCFGLHAISPDCRWSTWGWYWIEDWVGRKPDAGRIRLRRDLMKQGGRTGDSASRYDRIRQIGSLLWPEEEIAKFPPLDRWPESQLEKSEMLARISDEVFGAHRGLRDPNLVTCNHCALVCGPDLKETGERYRALLEGGIVVPGSQPGTWLKAKDFEEAGELRRKYPIRVGRLEMLADRSASLALWTRRYFGFEPRSFFPALFYKWKLGRAVKKA